MSTGSIVKVVNTKAHNADENKNISQKHLRYITRNDATNAKLIACNMVDLDNILESFGFFAKSIGKNTGRPLKHIILSYSTKGSPQLSFEEYLQVTKEIANFYANDYQMVMAVHNNIPHRPHAHIVMDCLNLTTELKYSEGISELNQFKDFIDDILEKYHIPKLLRKKNSFILNENIATLDNINSKSNLIDEDIMFTANDNPFNTDYEPYNAKPPNNPINFEIASFYQSPTNVNNINKQKAIRQELLNFFDTTKSKPQSILFNFNKILED
ncbi:relaxase/mobilization nuclease domain-containing protein [Megamonas funiformis]|uniref:relaxase/mobilization nuclease domain-containing protein n=1 Tax=Megamonas funiformis TaxID=437897 RepID=UPI002672B205|nr:relaxase/mobilization nuclease domain-containing protein [Megamonas funiformis]